MAVRFSSLLACAAIMSMVPMTTHIASAETMEDAVVSAFNRHPSVMAALAGRDAADAEKSEAFAGYFPDININAATGRVYGDNSTSRGLSVTRGSGYSWNHEGGISLHQKIFDGMETSNRIDAADARFDSASLNVADVRENLGLRVVMAYLEVMRTQDAVNMISTHAKKITDYQSRIKKMVDQGAADESMSVQAHDIQNQLDGTLADVQGQRDKALADYAEAVGHSAVLPLTRPTVDAAAIATSADEAVKVAMDTHPALQSARARSLAAKEDIKAERGILLPDLTGEVSAYKKDLADVLGGEVVDERALLRLNWDFSTGGAQFARIKQAVHHYAEAKAQAEDLAGRMEREIRKAYVEMDASKKRLDISRDRVEVSNDLVKTYEKQFEAAKVTLLSILQAENTAFNAKLGVLNADYRYLAAQYSVLANTGHLQDALNIKPVSEVQAMKESSPVATASLTEPTPEPSAELTTPEKAK